MEMMQAGPVRAISECFIKPKSDIADHSESNKAFYLGAFELIQMSHFYLQMGLLFRKLEDGDSIIQLGLGFLERLKVSLRTTLDYFYPLAGQLVTVIEEETQQSFIYIDCNKGPGSKFIHATLDDVTVDGLASQSYIPEIVGSLFDLGQVPKNYDAHTLPMLVVQVTELVDGVFMGVSMNHAVADGATLWHFLRSWSEIFRSDDAAKAISRPPICERWFPEGYGPILKIPFHVHPADNLTVRCNVVNKTLREGVFHLSCEAVTSLKEKANAECEMLDSKISSFQALSAAIWRSIVRARGCPSNGESICLIVANARPRMVPPLPQEYLGCFIVPTFNHIKVSELVDKSLGSIALSVHQKVEEVTFEHLHNQFVKWIESPYFAPTEGQSPSMVVISGSPREDASGVEFGMGKAVMRCTGSNKYDGKVVLNSGKQGKGSVTAHICLPVDVMLALQLDQEFASLLS